MGLNRVTRTAHEAGIESRLQAVPSLALGTSEATLLEMTGAYAGFLAQGVRVTPYGLTELRRKSDGAPLMRGGAGQRVRVIDEKAAGELVWMMRQVVDGGTGARAALPGGRPAAGKTGTTQEARDAWFVGFTADYVTGVWMGYDDNTPLTGTTGGGLPAEIWHEVMTRIEEGQPNAPLPMITPDQMPPPQYPGQVYSANDPVFGNGGAQPYQPQPDGGEDVLTNVLRRLFGTRN